MSDVRSLSDVRNVLSEQAMVKPGQYTCKHVRTSDRIWTSDMHNEDDDLRIQETSKPGMDFRQDSDVRHI